MKEILKIAKRIFLFSWEDNKRIILSLWFIAIITTAISLVDMYVSGKVLDKVVYNISSIEKTLLIQYLGLLIVFSFAPRFLMVLSDSLFKKLELSLNKKIDKVFSLKKISVDVQIEESAGFEQLKQKASRQTVKIMSSIKTQMSIIQSLITLIPAIVIIVRISWIITLMFVVSAVVNFYFQVKEASSFVKVEEGRAKEQVFLSSFMGDLSSLSTLKDIRITSSGDFFLRKILFFRENINNFTWGYFKKIFNRRYLTHTIFGAADLVSTCILLFFLYKKQITIGGFMFAKSTMIMMRNSLGNLLGYTSSFYGDSLLVKYFFDFLDIKPALVNGNQKIDSFQSFELSDVVFRYPAGDRNVLEGISLSIKRGEKIALVGINGAGKTTLTKLLLRFYFPTEGSLSINGIPLEEIEKESWYRLVGYMGQDYPKYDLTFHNAIMTGDVTRGASGETIQSAAKKAGIHDFIMSHKLGYDTQIGKRHEGGVEMSGGQWQKLALARMFYRDPEVYILDEPTSAIDAIAEMEIFDQLSSLDRTKTVILISHRFNTVRHADRILVLDGAHLVEEGTHEDLMNNDGLYKQMFLSQKDSYEERAV